MRLLKPLDLFRTVLSSPIPGGLIGLDVGTTYIGVAVSDSKLIRAFPHSVIMRNDNNVDEMALQLQHLITEVPGLGFIVGYPSNRGRVNEDANQVYRLTYDLGKTNVIENVPYAHWEEAFTSKLAKCVIHPFNPDPRRTKRISDMIAAAGMLQGYLDAVNMEIRPDYKDSTDEDGKLD